MSECPGFYCAFLDFWGSRFVARKRRRTAMSRKRRRGKEVLRFCWRFCRDSSGKCREGLKRPRARYFRRWFRPNWYYFFIPELRFFFFKISADIHIGIIRRGWNYIVQFALRHQSASPGNPNFTYTAIMNWMNNHSAHVDSSNRLLLTLELLCLLQSWLFAPLTQLHSILGFLDPLKITWMTDIHQHHQLLFDSPILYIYIYTYIPTTHILGFCN